jgi:hypothetical protein
MKKIVFFTVIFAFVLGACAGTITSQPLETTVAPATEPPLLSTATPQLPTPTKIIKTDVPTETVTPGPVIDSQGNISWHPQDVLILSEEGGGDGAVWDYPPEFVLLWDGTLLQRGQDYLDPPFIAHVDQNEMCRILNTVDSSGFFEESEFYNFPFDGTGSQYISVNAWKSNTSGSQILSYAISGAPYYDGMFCRDCPIPSEGTVIRPGLANVYFFLKKYVPENREVAPMDKLKVYLEPADEEPTGDWPITSISLSELARKCEESFCYDQGMILDGPVAREIYENLGGAEVFVAESFMNSTPFRVRYRVAWPYEPSRMYYSSLEVPQLPKPPADAVLTCSVNSGQYPTLPLSEDNKYWYYAPDGKWGAEVVDDPGQILRVRVVNMSGYEKYYQYDPSFFNRSSLKVFPRFWTRDVEYFLVNILPGDFNAQEIPFVNSIGLQRISTADGKISYLFAGVEGQEYAYTLSANGGQVAYIRQGDQPLKIVIKDTYSGKEKAAALAIPVNGTGSYIAGGTLVWARDEKTLYVAATYWESDVDTGYIISVDVSNPAKQTIIYESTAPIKLNQMFYFGWDAGICSLTADSESHCNPSLNLEDGTIFE